MPKKPEQQIEDDVCIWADYKGIGHRKVQWVGRKAAPDRLFVYNGRMVFVEFKRPGKTRADPLQEEEHKWFAEHGVKIYLFDDTNRAINFLFSYFML